MQSRYLQAWLLSAVLSAGVAVQGAQSDHERVAEEIAQAEAAVKRAAQQKALWTSAEEALVLAKKYLADGKPNEARVPAILAKELAELGIAQTAYPLFSE